MTRAIADHAPVHTAELVYPLTLAQYHEMIRHGVLTDDDPVELLEGVLVCGLRYPFALIILVAGTNAITREVAKVVAALPAAA